MTDFVTIYRLSDVIPTAEDEGRGKTYLSDGPTADLLEVDYIRIRPGNVGAYHGHKAAHNIWIVLQGELTAIVGEVRYVVHAGEVIFMPANIPHASSNNGDKDVLAIEIYCPPHRKMPRLPWDIERARREGTLDAFPVELPAQIIDANASS